jgi:hypothetical protein
MLFASSVDDIINYNLPKSQKIFLIKNNKVKNYDIENSYVNPYVAVSHKFLQIYEKFNIKPTNFTKLLFYVLLICNSNF